MRQWPVQDAKARFSELLETCLKEGPQTITRRGIDMAILVSLDEWQRLRHTARPTLKALLLTDRARGDLALPPRGQHRGDGGGDGRVGGSPAARHGRRDPPQPAAPRAQGA